jgi:hypothetical protein
MKTAHSATLLASPSNRPSVGLAVVDSMAGCRIKAFASHAQGFSWPKPLFRRHFHAGILLGRI